MSFKAGTPKAAMQAQLVQYATLRQYASRLGQVSAFRYLSRKPMSATV